MPINIDQKNRIAQIKKYLSIVYQDDDAKTKNIDRTIKLVDKLIDFNSVTIYIKKLNGVLHLDKKDDDHTITLLELVGPVKDIVLDIFAQIEQIKSSLTKSNRKFIKANADLFALVCVISLFLKLDEEKLLNVDNFIVLLQSIARLTDVKIDLDVKKSWKNLFGLL